MQAAETLFLTECSNKVSKFELVHFPILSKFMHSKFVHKYGPIY